MATTVLTVTGMTCEHCEQAVGKELLTVDGVTGVSADAKAGRVTVDSAQPLSEEEVRAAVDEAGFELVSLGA
jgi:copper chaperone CopZ